MTENALLKIEGVCKSFGALQAVNNVSFSVEQEQIKALIGPNGAGKTTLINLLSGIYKADDGKIILNGQNISHNKPHQIAALGIARTYQNIQLFTNMTVVENVMVGCHLQGRQELLGAGLRLPGFAKEEKEILKCSLEYLEVVGLADHAYESADSLAFGQQRLLEIARALAVRPKLLLLDEPAAGLNSRETELLGELISRIRDDHCSLLLVDHDMELVMCISDEVAVLDRGEKIAEGTPEQVQRDESVIAAYLGEEV